MNPKAVLITAVLATLACSLFFYYYYVCPFIQERQATHEFHSLARLGPTGMDRFALTVLVVNDDAVNRVVAVNVTLIQGNKTALHHTVQDVSVEFGKTITFSFEGFRLEPGECEVVTAVKFEDSIERTDRTHLTVP